MLTQNRSTTKVQTSSLHRASVRRLLETLDQVTFSCGAYDTAWVGQVLDRPGGRHAYPQAIEWLRDHQHVDGSWGSDIEYFHDRIISTLAAILTLAKAGGWPSDLTAIAHGEQYIRRNIDFLAGETAETVGFGLLLPTLFDEAARLHLNLPYGKVEPYRRNREAMLHQIPSALPSSRRAPATHALEFLGSDIDISQLVALQEPNGSYGNSPSATAYVLSQHPTNGPARAYLDAALGTEPARSAGAVPPVFPSEAFQKSWSLYNIELTGFLNDFSAQSREHLEHLWRCWDSQLGVGTARGFLVTTLDDTAVAYKLLKRAGYPVTPEVFLRFEREACFTNSTAEHHPTIGANIHLLDALGIANVSEHRPRLVKKILKFLHSVRRSEGYWMDARHISPYYITAHAVIALIGFDNGMAREAVDWMLATQRADGSWGKYRSTAEETAYCLQALITYHNEVTPLHLDTIERGADYLYSQVGVWSMPAMWVDKCLFAPYSVIESAILSALLMSASL